MDTQIGPEFLEELLSMTDERKLLARAYCCAAAVRVGYMSPDLYADCMMVFLDKFGEPVTVKMLDARSAKYLHPTT